MESSFSTLISDLVDPVVMLARASFDVRVFVIWAVAGAGLFAALYIIARRFGVVQHFSIWTLIVPGATLCAVAAGIFGSQCGLLPPVLYAGMISAMAWLGD